MTAKMTCQPQTLTVQQAATLCRVAPSMVLLMVLTGRVRGYPLGPQAVRTRAEATQAARARYRPVVAVRRADITALAAANQPEAQR
jgi:hypothetical protein